ncbi:MAG: hypothetical protein F7C35_03555 [Desulfurococcales archaeon]|nr:hypothetical protein [Desulfurococcales archaeon]
MVLIVELEGKRYYACSKCGAIYKQVGQARRCEEYCSGGACNTSLTREAVGWIRRSLVRLSR